MYDGYAREYHEDAGDPYWLDDDEDYPYEDEDWPYYTDDDEEYY